MIPWCLFSEEDAAMSVSAERARPESRDAGARPDTSAYADDRTKSKKQLLDELVELRQRIRALEVEGRRH
jgi:hypothetical protein